MTLGLLVGHRMQAMIEGELEIPTPQTGSVKTARSPRLQSMETDTGIDSSAGRSEILHRANREPASESTETGFARRLADRKDLTDEQNRRVTNRQCPVF